jgi:chromosome segregation ATPase
VILEYLKKHRRSVAIKFASSLSLGCFVCLIVMGGILSNPLLLQVSLLAFITLLTPAGFGFLLFGLLLITGLLATIIWLGIESNLRKPKEGEHQHRINEKQLKLVEENFNHQTGSQVVALGLANWELSEEGKEIEVDDDSVEAFGKKAKEFLKTIDTVVSQPQTDIAGLEAQWKAFRRRYHKLSRIYHPDLELYESRKILKKEEFQRLSGIYEQVQKACDQLKKRIARNKLLHEMNELLKTHVEMLDRFIKQIRDDLKELKIEVAAQQQKIEEHDQKLEEHDQKFAENKQILEENKQILEENKKELNDLLSELIKEKNKEKVDETEEPIVTDSLIHSSFFPNYPS